MDYVLLWKCVKEQVYGLALYWFIFYHMHLILNLLHVVHTPFYNGNPLFTLLFNILCIIFCTYLVYQRDKRKGLAIK